MAVVLAGPYPGAYALPPPPVQVTADCAAPTYASDMLVCEDAELRALDDRLAGLTDAGVDDAAWFRHSRRCAFEADQRACLTLAYCLRIALLDSGAESLPGACATEPGEYGAASSIARNGFARNGQVIAGLDGGEVRLWGYVDHANLYGDAAARDILGAWWGGAGPDAGHWRFNLKASAADPAGASFAVQVPNDLLRDDWLRLFAADGAAGRPTRVYIRGTLHTFDAPTGGARLTGLRLELSSSMDMRLGNRGGA